MFHTSSTTTFLLKAKTTCTGLEEREELARKASPSRISRLTRGVRWFQSCSNRASFCFYSLISSLSTEIANDLVKLLRDAKQDVSPALQELAATGGGGGGGKCH